MHSLIFIKIMLRHTLEITCENLENSHVRTSAPEAGISGIAK